MNRNLAHLGMAKKAGLLAVGSEAAAVAARRGDAKLIITANDASEASKRRAKHNAEGNGIPHIAVPFTMFELGQAAGRGSPGTIAFLDKGLADGFKKRLEEAKSHADTAGSTTGSATSAKESDA
jgi:ribosomal protein L7Ae-like RNA K-turn-binding protein